MSDSGRNEAHDGLDVDEFTHGIRDHDAAKEPPRITSWSYDKGRAFGSRVPPCCRSDRDYPLFTAMGCRHEKLRRLDAMIAAHDTESGALKPLPPNDNAKAPE